MTENQSRSESTTQEPPAQRSKRRVTKTILTFVVIAAVIALIVSAILFQQWVLFWLGVIIIIPYALLLMAPVWLARSSQVAAKERKTGDESREEPSKN